ncbi:MAG: hypothetical protein ACOH2R_08580 [Pseudomonas sp.]
MAAVLGQRSGNFLTDQKIIDGYLVTAKKVQLVSSKPGVPAHMQSLQVKNSVRLSTLIMDLPAFLCLPGRIFIPVAGGQRSDVTNSYVQSLTQGRDSYLPTQLVDIVEPQLTPLTLAATFNFLTVGSVTQQDAGGGTRFWGHSQPFTDVGCVYGFCDVYLPDGRAPNNRWVLTYARPEDSVVYRLQVLSPTYFRYQVQDGVFTPIPETPSAEPASWSLEVSTALLNGVGAVPFTLFEGATVLTGFEANWETAQYPWMSFSQPKQFVDDEGNAGFTVLLCAQVVYEYGGPYPQTLPNDTNGWGEVDIASPAGGRGLWVAQVQVIKGIGTILHQYRVYGGDSGDQHRQPLVIDHRSNDPPYIFPYRWYQDNVVYKTAPVVLATGEAILPVLSYVDSTHRPDDSSYSGRLFFDVLWFADGARRSQNILASKLTRDVAIESQTGSYIGHLTAFDARVDDARFLLGAATDGTVAVIVAFSSFRPGNTPQLRILVADKTAVTPAYTGNPGFAPCAAFCRDEMVDVQYTEHPAITGDPQKNSSRWWSWPTGDGQVTYIGNNKFMFYVSTQWTTPLPDTDTNFVPSANVGVATFDAKSGLVAIAGVVDPTMFYSGLPTGLGVPLSSVLTQTWSSARLGAIEVVRPESDGYIVDSGKGHPATLIVTYGRGNAGASLADETVFDITNGATLISYDSGVTWTQFLRYGSPMGAYHCGNMAQARTEPVVRV